MKVLVTGADGFVGRHLTAHLEAAGDVVTGCDRTTGTDILDAEQLGEMVGDLRPDAVFHLAGAADVGASWTAPLDTFRANAEGTLNVLRACVDAKVGRVLVVSSADVYGIVSIDELPLTETSPLRPVSPYAASKVAADFLALQAHLGFGLDTVRARAFNHLGPGQSPAFVAPALAFRIAEAERSGADEIPVGNLEARRDFTDVRDVVRAYRLLVTDGVPGEVYNVCSGIDLSIADLAARLVDMATSDVRLVPDPSLQRPVDTPVLRGDNSRITAATGWQPEIGIDQTLGDLLADARARVRAN